MHHQSMKECLALCQDCHSVCQETLFTHCLSMGGKHVEEAHVKLLADCIQICQTAADFMERGSEFHAYVCEACATICEACADSCETIGGAEMKACAEICRRCADSCRDMANMKEAA